MKSIKFQMESSFPLKLNFTTSFYLPMKSVEFQMKSSFPLKLNFITSFYYQ